VDANQTTVDAALALKANQTTVDAALALKANQTTVDAALALKATQTAVDAALALKANQTNVDANQTTVDAALGLKANQTTVDAALALKANQTTVDAALGLKANQTTVDAALGLKANQTTVNAALELKADKLQYPLGNMTQNSQTLPGGTYTASASTVNGSLEPFQAFDADISSVWHSTSEYELFTGIPKITAATTLVDDVNVVGEWLQLTMPTAVAVTRVTITAYYFEGWRRSPRDFIVAALVDGEWTQVLKQVGLVWVNSEQKAFEFDTIQTSASYRIITQLLGIPGQSSPVVNFADVRFIEEPVRIVRDKVLEVESNVNQGIAELQTSKANNTILLPAIEYPPSVMTQNTEALTGGTYTASASDS
jgi:hypothetical protein